MKKYASEQNLIRHIRVLYCLEYIMAYSLGDLAVVAAAANKYMTPVLSTSEPARHYSELYHLRPKNLKIYSL